MVIDNSSYSIESTVIHTKMSPGLSTLPTSSDLIYNSSHSTLLTDPTSFLSIPNSENNPPSSKILNAHPHFTPSQMTMCSGHVSYPPPPCLDCSYLCSCCSPIRKEVM